MTATLIGFERATRLGELDSAVAVLLDGLEAAGALASPGGDQVRARIHALARARATWWTQMPEIAAVDVYARTLDLPQLDRVRPGWDAELDRRGPWLRPLRTRQTDASVIAELPSCGPLAVDDHLRLGFVRGDQLELRHPEIGAWLWSFTRGRLEPIDRDTEPVRAARAQADETLPWPEDGYAKAQPSADGRTLLVFGWFAEYCGLLRWVDPHTHQIRREHPFHKPVRELVERPGTEDLLVACSDALTILGPEGPRWTRAGAVSQLAWSGDGRYIAFVEAGMVRVIDREATPTSTKTDPALPLSFSADGDRLVDGPWLLDGRSGAPIAALDVTLGDYLEGGPPNHWLHVGTELSLCLHGGPQAWATRTGARIELGETPFAFAFWRTPIAYSRSGHRLVWSIGRNAFVLGLPPWAELAEVVLGFDAEQLALSADGERIAAYGAGQLEVRRVDGTVLARGQTPIPRAPARVFTGRLRWSADGRRLLLHEPEQRSWTDKQGESRRPAFSCAWELDGDTARVIDSDEPALLGLPSGWSVDAGPTSTLTHTSGARIVMPWAGPWLANPAEPRIFACPGGLFELRGLATGA